MKSRNRATTVLTILGVLASVGIADDWPQWLGPQRDGVWRETGTLNEFAPEGPKIAWRTKVAGGYSGPAVAGGKIYLTDFVRESGDATPSPDVKSELSGRERVLCLDERTGEILWMHEYDRPYKISYPAGPRATPLVDDSRVYTLGAQGDLICLDTKQGEVVWHRKLEDEYHEAPIWGFASHPLIHGDKLICLAGGEGSAVVALNKHTGKEVWRALSTPDIGYSPPTLIQAGGKLQLIVWLSDALNSVDPETGKLYWSEPFEPDYKMSIAPPQQVGDVLFVGAIKFKSMALRLAADKPAAEVLWKGSKPGIGLGPSHSPIAFDPQTPEYIYGVDRGGELRCVELETGKQIWETYALMQSRRRSNAGTGFITRNGDKYFIFSETGELIIAKLSPDPDGYHEIDRTQPLLKATHDCFGRGVIWSPPAFANGAMLVRNDEELIRVSLTAD